MVYLIDANVLIDAHQYYYPIHAVPEFWDWLAHMGEGGHIKMPIETMEEVKGGGKDAERDLLFGWIQDDADPGNRCVVTTEVSRRTLQRQNRRIPDVCADVGVQCCNTFTMLRALNFSTHWRP